MSDGLSAARRLVGDRARVYQEGRAARESGKPNRNPYGFDANTIETEAGPMILLGGGVGFGPDLDLAEAWSNGWSDGGGV